MKGRHLTKNSLSFGFARQCGLGMGLMSFGQVIAFADPSMKKLYCIAPLKFKTERMHLRSWLGSLHENAPGIVLSEYEHIDVPADKMPAMLDDFLRLP